MNTDTLRLKAQLAVLRDAARQYGGLTKKNIKTNFANPYKKIRRK